MTLRITFHAAAKLEFVEASQWYESKRTGLGSEYIAAVEKCIGRASKQPFQFSVVRVDIRRAVISRFPYIVYFRAEEDRLVVPAIFNVSRNPTSWSARI